MIMPFFWVDEWIAQNCLEFHSLIRYYHTEFDNDWHRWDFWYRFDFFTCYILIYTTLTLRLFFFKSTCYTRMPNFSDLEQQWTDAIAQKQKQKQVLSLLLVSASFHRHSSVQSFAECLFLLENHAKRFLYVSFNL